ncbi:MAG: DUF695 domain-containing protein [Anaeromyxobacteraceae bacterium]
MSRTVAVVVAVLLVGVVAAVWRARSSAKAGAVSMAPRPSGFTDPIDAFWAWWREAGPRLAARIDAGKAAEIEPELTQHVHAIDEGLAWETGKGLRGARHHLALSAEGDARLRVVTERWVSRAPAADAAWEYYPARQAWHTTGARLTMHDPDFTLEEATMRVSPTVVPEREVLDVRIYSPAFAKIPEDARLRGTYLLLDNLLGEDAVEKWLGRIEPVTEPVAPSEPLVALREQVARLASTAIGDRWVILKETDPEGAPIFHTVNLALKRVDHLLMDQHLAVTLPLKTPTAEGLTTDAEAERLNQLEDALLADLGHDAVQIGRQTGHGRRTIHLHAAAVGPAEQRARDWARGVNGYAVEIDSRPDPGWEILKRY